MPGKTSDSFRDRGISFPKRPASSTCDQLAKLSWYCAASVERRSALRTASILRLRFDSSPRSVLWTDLSQGLNEEVRVRDPKEVHHRTVRDSELSTALHLSAECWHC